MEVWKDIEGCEGFYQVSNLGNVKSLMFGKEKKIKSHNNQKGYLYIAIGFGENRKKQAVHRLVANAFIENKENKETVNHKDFNRQNNNLENLEWCTYKENTFHAFQNKTINIAKGEKSGMSKLTEKQVLEIRASTLSKKELSIKFKVKYSCISRIINRKRWNHI